MCRLVGIQSHFEIVKSGETFCCAPTGRENKLIVACHTPTVVVMLEKLWGKVVIIKSVNINTLF